MNELMNTYIYLVSIRQESLEVLAAKEMTFESLCKRPGGQS